MTYKEFEKWCEDNGYVCTSDNKRMRVYCNGFPVLSITITAMYSLSSDWISSNSKELFEKAVELASTPLEEREEPKRYYVKIVDREDGYINKTSSGELLLFNRAQWLNYQTKFTEEEIKAIDERYMAFAEEVEE